ncbi:MAG: hypothetical protein FCKEOINB_01610 [Nitrosomonas sp.]|nr:hypothetical protein [Nitrosomonas sp.]
MQSSTNQTAQKKLSSHFCIFVLLIQFIIECLISRIRKRVTFSDSPDFPSITRLSSIHILIRTMININNNDINQ